MNGWIDRRARRLQRQAAINYRPPPPPQRPAVIVSPALIDLTTQPELAAVVAAVAAEANVQPMNLQNDDDDEIVQNETQSRLSIRTPAAINAMSDEHILMGQRQATQSVSVQTEPIQSVHHNMQRVLNFLYHHCEKMLQNKQILDGGITLQPNIEDASRYLRQMMSRIDSHFRDTQRTTEIDLDIVRFLSNANNFNVTRMFSWDRIRVALMLLEIERIEVETENERIRRLATVIPLQEQKKIVCPVCDEKIEPSREALLPKCRHVHCANCITQIRISGNATCSICRHSVRANEDVIPLRFKYNGDKNAICRSCLIPFKLNDNTCVFSRCGHAYHSLCVVHEKECQYCPMTYNNQNEKKPLFIKFNE